MAVQKYYAAPDPLGSQPVNSVEDLLKYLGNLPASESALLLFRGHSRHTFALEPGIYREAGWIENEDVMFKELVLRCPADFSSSEATFETLVRMQHYSLPTRLLDLTANPLVALFFACQSELHYEKESGELVILQIPKDQVKYYDSDTVSVIANLSRRPKTFAVPVVDGGIDLFNEQKELQLLLHEIRAEKPYFAAKIQPDHLSSVICVKPKLANARIIRQEGAFLLFGVDGVKIKPAKVPSKILLASSRVVVPGKAKKKVLGQLRDLGITYASLFPEIDRVAAHIREVYRVKTAAS